MWGGILTFLFSLIPSFRHFRVFNIIGVGTALQAVHLGAAVQAVHLDAAVKAVFYPL